mmetsp:Transcript_37063/g.78609  ORF Transcript_37063/g.78609 Transcript_37063/m.78609 type:complete len:499 (+) Transcript_37063:154-1650(+)
MTQKDAAELESRGVPQHEKARPASVASPAISSSGSRSNRRPTSARRALVVFSLVNLLSAMDRMAPNAVKELIIHDLKLTDMESSLPSTLGLVAYLIFGQLAGYIVHRNWIDLTVFLTAAVLLWSVCTLLQGFAQSIVQLSILRFLVSAGEATFPSIVFPVLTDLYSPADRPTAFALVLAAMPLGSAMGFSFGGLAGSSLGWRAALCLAGAPGIFVAALVPTVPMPKQQGCNSDSDTEGVPYVALQEEATVTSDLWTSYKTILSNPHWATCTAAMVVANFGLISASEWLPTYIVREFRVTTEVAGSIVGIALLLGGFFGTLAFGKLAQWWAVSMTSAYLLAPAIGELLSAPLLSASIHCSGALHCCLWLSVATFFVFSFQAPGTSIVMEVVPRDLRAQSIALSTFIIRTADIFGPITCGGLSDRTDLQTAMNLLPICNVLAACVFFGGYLCLPSLPTIPADDGSGRGPSFGQILYDEAEEEVEGLKRGMHLVPNYESVA